VNPIRMIRTHSYKLVIYDHYGDELYDMKQDPFELNNVAADPQYARIRKRLSRKLNKWIKRNHDPFYDLKATDRTGKPLD